jgi:formate hydrogenlyase subunit 3/multisubunit Na+/H+ antiporter MnhD subunit
LTVHLPIALTVLVPLFAIGAMWAVRRGVAFRRAWGVAVGMLALLFASAWLALQTGQQEEDRVENVVAESAIEVHEEAAERFLVWTGVVLLVASAGFLRGRSGAVARGVATLGTLTLVGAGYAVGHSGGNLVYREGAAMAYASPASPGSATSRDRARDEEHDEKKH